MSTRVPEENRRPEDELLAAGDVLAGRYRIARFIARGGMGEVYEAHDQTLRVDVALKTIRAKVAASPRASERFRREILLARSISHPNICRIYDLGNDPAGELSFLTMELLRGESLAQRLRTTGRMSTTAAAPLAADMASALSAAHEAGVLHRDLKSANLHLVPGARRERIVVTDFGLAQTYLEDVDEDSTRLTSAGVVVGTFSYMSPEQLEGKTLGPASDIYSLGVVLFEMLTGEMPFKGGSPMKIASLRLNQDAPTLASRLPGVEEPWNELVRRCLARQPADRFASCDEILAALYALGLPSSAFVPQGASSRAARASASAESIARQPAAPVTAIQEQPTTVTPSPELVPSAPASDTAMRPSRRMRWLPTVLVVTTALLAGAAWMLARARADPPLPTALPRQLTHVPGWATEPAIAPDGSLVAYIAHDGHQQDLWVVDASGAGEPLRLTDDEAKDHAPSWSPDGSWIAFESDRSGRRGVWKIGRLGGGATALLTDAGAPAISPDGRRIAFTRTNPGEQYARVWWAALGGSSAATQLTDDDDGLWDHTDPQWSPDGTKIAYGDINDLWVVAADGGKPRRLTTPEHVDSHPAWSPSGRNLYFTSSRGSTTALWRINAATGVTRRVTLGTGSESMPTVAGDGLRMAYSTFDDNADLVIHDLTTGERVRLPDRGNEFQAAFAPDGSRVVYTAMREGEPNLWLQNLDGGRPVGEPTRLTEFPSGAANLSYSPDGQWLAFHRAVDGQRDVWTMSAAGGPPIQVTHDPATDVQPVWSPDGDRLLFTSTRDAGADHYRLWTIGISEGSPVGLPKLLTDEVSSANHPTWSPDGATIAYVEDDNGDVFLVDAEATDATPPPRRITQGANAKKVRWERPGSDTILVSGLWDDTSISLRRVSTENGTSRPFEPPITFGNADRFGSFDLAASGQHLILARSEARGDIWLLQVETGSY